jgi:hypothetical protein
MAVSYGCVMLADATFRFTRLDGRAEEITGKAGQVPSSNIEHLPENFREQIFGAIALELKD